MLFNAFYICVFCATVYRLKKSICPKWVQNWC